MARTLNRQPYSVDTDVDIKYKFFNHVNWKGLTDDKNYFNIDQETFEDCKNVYIDGDGLLKSRPSFKLKTIKELDAHDIRESWKFGDIVVYKNYTYLHFIHNDNIKTYNVESEHVKLLQVQSLIFIFTPNNTYVYDGVRLNDATNYIYTPITTVKTIVKEGDITTKVSKDNEYENILTDSKSTQYIFSNVDKIQEPELVGKTLTFTINGSKVTTNFNEVISDVLFASTGITVEKSTNTEKIFGPKESIVEYIIDVAKDADILLVCNYKLGSSVQENIWKATAIINNNTYINVPLPADILSKPYISDDGTTVFVIKNDGIYAKSILPIAGAYEYTDWTFIHASSKPINYHPNVDVNMPNVAIGAKFKSPSNFVICYGHASSSTVDGKIRFNETETDVTYSNYDDLVIEAVVNEKVYVKTIQPLDGNKSGALKFQYLYPNFIRLDYIAGEDVYVVVNYKSQDKTYGDVYDSILYTTMAGDSVLFDVDNRETLYDGIYNRDLYLVNHLRFFQVTSVISEPNSHQYYRYDVSLLDGNIDGLTKTSLTAIPYSRSFVIKFNRYYTGKTDILPVHVLGKYYYWYTNDIHNKIIENVPEYNLEPIASSKKFLYGIRGGVLYTNNLSNYTVEALYTEASAIKPFYYDYHCELNENYFSKGNELYISSNRSSNNKPFLYIPKVNTQKFNSKITNIHPVSNTQVAIFFDDEIWYSNITEVGYEYYKSKLQVGLREGSNVITSPDGKNVIFSSSLGLVYMSYEELVQSTEQTLKYLSNGIFDTYEKFNKKPVKLFLYNFWLICYHIDEKEFLIFDVRNNSWWKWEYYQSILNILLIDNEPEFLTTNGLRYVDRSYSNYYDYEGPIHWSITSQKLHLGTLNYYKNIVSIIINNVETETVAEDVSFNLTVKNYRIDISDRYDETQNLLYKVNMLRTFVKRCNSRKVNAFQYTLSSDTDINGNAIQLPLSINSIIVKYTLSGQVR